jgi:aminoacyl tRNA synthase complex-interacting multifunctional protein 1
MAATPLDDKVKNLVAKSYPQANGTDETDAVKLSSAIFSSAEVCTY